MPESIVTAAAVTETGPEKPAEATPATPAIPEKFMKDGKPDYDALAKSYTELEKRVSAQPAPVAKPAAEPAKAPETPNTPAPSPTATPPGFEKFEKEFQTNGKLSPESYAEIAKSDPRFTEEVVNDFIAFRTGKEQAFANEVYSSIGGEEVFKQLSDWASKNLTADELNAVNDTLANTKNPAAAKLALSGLKAKFVNAVGAEPETVVAGGVDSGNLAEFSSMAEATKALRDPRYKTDANYRKSVDARMNVSNTIFASR